MGFSRITEEQYTKITNCSDSILGRSFPNIPFDMVQNFLNKRGYNIVIHRGEYKNATIMESVTGTGEVRSIGNMDVMKEVILAIKSGQELPTVISSKEAKEMYLWIVFSKELLTKLLFE